MQRDHQRSDDVTERDLGRRGFLTLSALVAGGSALGGLDSVAGAPVNDRLFETPRWSSFRSILRAQRGYLLTGIRTNSASEQVGWAVRLDDDLDVVWNYAYLSPRHLRQTDSGEDHDGLEFALPDGDGGFLLVGWWHTLGSDSRYGWLTRTGSDGIPRWSRVYNRDGVNSFRDDFADGVATDDGFLLVGRTIGGEYLDERTGDGWVVEIERGRRGRVRWQRAYDPNGPSDGWDDDDHHSEFNGVASVDDGYLIVGETSPDGPTESTNTAAWALRIGNDGGPRWSRTYRLDRRRNNEFRDVAAVDDGFFVAGVAGAKENVRELHDYKMQGRSWAAKLDRRGRLVWEDASGGDGFHAVEATENGAVFAGRRDGRGWIAAFDDDGNRLGSDRSSVPNSEYFGLTTRSRGSRREYLPVGYGRGDDSTNGLLSRFAADDFDNGGGDDNGDDDDDERLFEIIATERGEVRYELTVDGGIEPVRLNDRVKAEDDDRIRENDDGTVSVRGSTGNEGYGDAFRFTGAVTDFRSRGDADFYIRLDGERVSVDELLDEDDDDEDDDDDDDSERLFELIATERGEVRYELTVDGDIEPVRLNDRVKAEDDDRIRENNDGTVTVTGSTGNEGYGDAFRITGSVIAFRSRGDADFYIRLDGERVSVDELLDEDDDEDDDDDDDSERLFEIVATETGEVRYDLTVTGDIEPVRLNDRVKAEDDDRIRENNEGTVTVTGSTGNEGYGDAFRITGSVVAFRSRGDADFYIRLDGERVTVDELLDD
ncbi:hypothetical protein C461_00762 [Halorubrum aidingense JCM 13560]|uniref:Uncharacterized protein n=1 Tax=Halorubrum aidingense JCM 13560 TaxID=1230454 RepID=M0PPG5_9EURY|nr:hypothetical protein [Halorubrum aidingense]EMA70775.1 hypothetical protein C461_00762 [Halorubrum aidingense JCM 13560]